MLLDLSIQRAPLAPAHKRLMSESQFGSPGNPRSALILVTAIVMLCASAPASFAADSAAGADRELGVRLAEEGRCEAALEVFDRIQTDPATDGEVTRLDGACSIRLQDFRRAISKLSASREIDPVAKDVDLLLGMALYHSGRMDAAAEALERAAAIDGGRAEFLLYSGLVAYARTDFEAAAGRLTAASQLSDAPVEPMASYFLGRAELGANDRDQARAAFERVIGDYPGTPWAEEAARALEEIDRGAFTWWANAELGYEYDDNALLRGRNVGLPSDVSRESDHRGFWFIDVGATLFEVAGWKAGGMLRYAGSEHDDLEQFDTHSPGATVWVDRDLKLPALGDASLRIQYDFDSPFIDYRDDNRDPFVMSHLVGTSLYKPWNDGIYSLLSTSFGVDDYGYQRTDTPDLTGNTPSCATLTFCGPPINEKDATDRDGQGVSVSLLHHIPLGDGLGAFSNPWVEGEYRFQQYWSEGREYDHQRHQVEVGVGIQLPLEVGLRVRGRYAYAPYGQASVFPDPSAVSSAIAGGLGTAYVLDTNDRNDHEMAARVSLERALGELAVLTARYGYTRNRSNSDVFDYGRHLFGLSVRIGFGG